MRGETEEALFVIMDFASELMRCGSQTARIFRNVERISSAWGYAAHIIILPKTIIMTLTDRAGASFTAVKKVDSGALNFWEMSELRKLSWSISEGLVSIGKCKSEMARIRRISRISGVKLLLAVSAGNAAFCGLFNGGVSMLAVFFATILAFEARSFLASKKMPVPLCFFFAAFAVSGITVCILKLLNIDGGISLYTGVLFLVPGIPLLNSAVDILDGHVLAGMSRFFNAMTLVFAAVCGLAFALAVFGRIFYAC